MKGFTDPPGGKKTANIKVSALLNNLMSTESSSSSSSRSRASLRRVNLEGSNVGAAMIVRRNSTSLGETNEGSGVNIYITNNVQGVHNSVLVGSEVNMGDPGLWLTLKDSKLERGFVKRRIDIGLGLCGLLVIGILVVYLVITFVQHIDW